MGSGRGRSLCWAGLLAFLLGLPAGCVTSRTRVEQAVLAGRPPPAHLAEIANAYHAHCPDVLRVDIADAPHYSGAQRIGPDGRIHLGDACRPRVDGETAAEIVRTVAQSVGVSPEHVHVQVAEYNSQYLYLIGPVDGLQRAVPYRGPETVLDLLRRVDGVTPATAVRDVKIIRPHIADGKTPEVFHIDLAAIVLRNDPETNVILEPYDQVHIGQSRRSCIDACLPPWLRPLYERLCGMKHEPQGIGNRE